MKASESPEGAQAGIQPEYGFAADVTGHGFGVRVGPPRIARVRRYGRTCASPQT